MSARLTMDPPTADSVEPPWLELFRDLDYRCSVVKSWPNGAQQPCPNRAMWTRNREGRPEYVCFTCKGLYSQDLFPPPSTADDPVSHPAHYTFGKIEVIEVIEDWGWGLPFCLGNAVKYIARAGRKDPAKLVQDLEKARWYLDRAISALKKEKKTDG
jgi:hypothetical protein